MDKMDKMDKPILTQGKYYHIFNKGRRGENLFKEIENYSYFLGLYEKYIEPISSTFAWALLPNHFHFLVKINDEGVEKVPHQYFSNFFNAYTKAINKRFHRYGPLFVENFERREITNSIYFRNLVHYIHNNPVHHGFTERMIDYPWSSYQTIISIKESKLKRDEVLGWFNSKGEFINSHKQKLDYTDIVDLIIE